MKKIFLPLFIIILTLCCFCSCGNNSSQNKDNKSSTSNKTNVSDISESGSKSSQGDTVVVPNEQPQQASENLTQANKDNSNNTNNSASTSVTSSKEQTASTTTTSSAQNNSPQNNDTLLGLQAHSPQEVQSAIRILNIGIYRIDSVGGVEPQVCWRNESQKAIKYIHFYLEPYNAVSDKVYCQISGQSITDCTSTGPFEESPKSQIDALKKINIGQDKYYIYDNDGNRWSSVHHSINEDKLTYTCWYDILQNHEITEENSKLISYFDVWDPIWYNNSVKSIKLCGIKIEYMDGTNMNINSTSAQYALW